MHLRKAIIPAAGRGSRHFPASLAVRKELFPFVDSDGKTRPAIDLIVSETLSAGIDEVCIVTAPGDDEAFRRYFEGVSEADPGVKPEMVEETKRLREIGKRITYAEQTEPLGYGHAVWCAKEFANGEPVLVVLGDHVYASFEDRTCAKQLVDAFHQYDASVSSVKLIPENKLHLCGIIRTSTLDGPPWLIEEIVEKPSVEEARERLQTPGVGEPPYLGWFGTHAMSYEVFDCLDEMISSGARQYGEYQFTVAQSMLAGRSKYFAAPINGETYDFGIPPGFATAESVLVAISPYGQTAFDAVDHIKKLKG